MKAKILKRMVSLGKTLEVGDIVDVSDWRHTKSLVSNRYIEIVDSTPVAKTKVEPKVEPKIEAPKAEEVVEEAKPKKAKKEVVEE